MATIAKTKDTAKVRLYLADDFRQEVDQKVTGVGLYTDLVIVANVKAEAASPSKEQPIVLAGITALVTITGLTGPHEIGVELKDPLAPLPHKLEGPRTMTFPSQPSSANIMIRFQPLATGGPGIKHIVVSIDGRKTKLAFEVRLGVLPDANEPSEAKRLPPAKKKTKQIPRQAKK